MPDAAGNDRDSEYELLKRDLMRRGRNVEEAEAIAARSIDRQRRQEGAAPQAGAPAATGTALPLERSYRELYAEAKTRAIPGRSTMSKQELEQRLAR